MPRTVRPALRTYCGLPSPMPEIGPRIAEARNAVGHTQAALAAEIGVHEMTVSRWERGLIEPCSGHLIALADALDCTTDWLLGRED